MRQRPLSSRLRINTKRTAIDHDVIAREVLDREILIVRDELRYRQPC